MAPPCRCLPSERDAAVFSSGAHRGNPHTSTRGTRNRPSPSELSGFPRRRRPRGAVPSNPMAPQRTFFVESYVPQLDAAGATAPSARLRAAVSERQGEGHALARRPPLAPLGEDEYILVDRGVAPV